MKWYTQVSSMHQSNRHPPCMMNKGLYESLRGTGGWLVGLLKIVLYVLRLPITNAIERVRFYSVPKRTDLGFNLRIQAGRSNYYIGIGVYTVHQWRAPLFYQPATNYYIFNSDLSDFLSRKKNVIDAICV